MCIAVSFRFLDLFPFFLTAVCSQIISYFHVKKTTASPLSLICHSPEGKKNLENDSTLSNPIINLFVNLCTQHAVFLLDLVFFSLLHSLTPII